MSDIPEPVLKRAYGWYARVVGRDLDAAEQQDLASWLDADPSHLAAYERAQILWSKLEHVDPEQLQRSRTAFRATQRHFSYKPIAWIGTAIAAMLLILVYRPFSTEAPTLLDYATKIAEVRDIKLKDGSVISLGAASRVTVALEDDHRSAHLIAGEAWFDVAGAPDRPFSVDAGALTVLVHGTQFSVSRVASMSEVRVAEGVVAVTPARTESTSDQSRRLRAGEQLTGNHDGLSEVTAVDPKQVGAWREGRLIYVNAALSRILADADRYYAGSINVASANVGQMTLSVVLDANDTETMLAALQAALPIQVERQTDGLIRISERP